MTSKAHSVRSAFGTGPIVCGNWKMNLGPTDGVSLLGQVAQLAADFPSVQVWVAPPFLTVPSCIGASKGSRVNVGTQNVHWEKSGAFTGEVSVEMLQEAGCSFAIVGHSERRHLMGETDALVAQRAAGAIGKGLTAIFCIGETLAEREGGQTEAVIIRQFAPLIAAINGSTVSNLVIAYEPVWAIGTGRVATIEQIQETHGFIRSHFETATGQKCPAILYGGSVKPDNFEGIIALEDVAGALVGGASLKADQFGPLVTIAAKA